jgi:hypothetical protein
MKYIVTLVTSTILSLLLIGLIGCSSEPAASPVEQALALAPATTVEFHFTDWAQLREYAANGTDAAKGPSGVPDYKLYPSAGTTLAKNAYILEQQKPWGWDYADVTWEVKVFMPDGLFTTLLRLADDFDMATMANLYEERGFAPVEQFQDLPVYSYPGGPSGLTSSGAPEWAQGLPADLLISSANGAVLEEEKILMMGPSLDLVKDILAVYQDDDLSLWDDTATPQVLENLGAVPVASLRFGCPLSRVRKQIDWALENIETAAGKDTLEFALSEQGNLHAYEALGIGYRYAEGEPSGTIVLQYNDGAQASADLEVRRELLTNGVSLRWLDYSFGETVLAVTDVAVKNEAMVIQGDLPENNPRPLMTVLHAEDILFAICPR